MASNKTLMFELFILTVSALTLFLCHFLKVSYDRASSQLVNNLLPRAPFSFSTSPTAPTSFCLRCLLALREPEVPQVHSDLPGHGPAAQQAVNVGATLAWWRLLWGGSGEQVFRVCEVVPVQRGRREQESI